MYEIFTKKKLNFGMKDKSFKVKIDKESFAGDNSSFYQHFIQKFEFFERGEY